MATSNESPLSLTDQVLLFNSCHRFLKSGLPLTIGLAHVRENCGRRLARVVERLENAVSVERLTLAAAFAAHFPGGDPFVLAMIEQGEISGRLDGVFAELETACRRALDRRRKVMRDLTYPAVLIVLCFLIWPVPRLVSDGPVAYLSAALPPLAGFAALLAFGSWLATSHALPAGQGAAFDRFVLALPLAGKIARAVATSRFSRSLGLLVRAGIPLDRAIELAAASSKNRHLAARIRPAVQSVRTGKPISRALAPLSDLLPPTFFAMVTTGEASGELDRTLVDAGELYEQEANGSIETLMRIVGPAINLAVMIAIGIHVVGFYSSYFDQIRSVR